MSDDDVCPFCQLKLEPARRSLNPRERECLGCYRTFTWEQGKLVEVERVTLLVALGSLRLRPS